MKCTTEQNLIENYVKLCSALFKVYNSNDDKELNFKKLLLTKCQKQFYRNSEGEVKTKDEDFSETNYKVFDEIEMIYFGKVKMFGNIKLIGELFCLGQISDKIIQECIVYLFREINDNNIEILSQLIEKITRVAIEPFYKRQSSHKKKKDTNITSSYLYQNLQSIFELRNSKELSSRIRFKIQDLMDCYNKEWKFFIEGQNKVYKEKEVFI